MGYNNSKFEICANYRHFNIKKINSENIMHDLKLYPCFNTHNREEGLIRYGRQKIPRKVIAKFSREYPRNHYIFLCAECYRKYYRGKDKPKKLNNELLLSDLYYYQYQSMETPIWNSSPKGFST